MLRLREKSLEIGAGVSDQRFVAVYFNSPRDQLAQSFIFAPVIDGEDL